MKELLLFTVAGLFAYDYHKKSPLHRNSLVDKEVQLIPEPTNRYDPFAIEVKFNNDKLGYVPRTQTSVIHNAIGKNKLGKAVVIFHEPSAIVVKVYDNQED